MMATYFLQHGTGIKGDFTNVLRLDEDGTVWTLGEGEQDPAYLAWVAEGNTAEEWNPE